MYSTFSGRSLKKEGREQKKKKKAKQNKTKQRDLEKFRGLLYINILYGQKSLVK